MSPAELISKAKTFSHGVAKHGDYIAWVVTYDRRDGTSRTRTAWRWRDRRITTASLPPDLDLPPLGVVL